MMVVLVVLMMVVFKMWGLWCGVYDGGGSCCVDDGGVDDGWVYDGGGSWSVCDGVVVDVLVVVVIVIV